MPDRTVNPAIWGAFYEPSIRVENGEFDIPVQANYDRDTYSTLCIEEISCSICQNPTECDGFHEQARTNLSSVSLTRLDKPKLNLRRKPI